MLRIAIVQPLAVLDRQRQAISRLQTANALGNVVAPDVGAEQHAFLPVESGRGVPDLRDVALGPGDAAVDLVVLLPEAAIGLERDLDHLGIGGCRDRGPNLRREVGGNAGEHRERYGADAKVAPDRALGTAPAIAIDDADTLAVPADLASLRAVADRAVDAALEGGGDPVHAADGLQHGRREIDEFRPVELEIREDRLQEIHPLERR